MISFNEKSQPLTLTAVFKGDKTHPLIVQQDQYQTLISEENKLYVYFNEKLTYKKTYQFFLKWTKSNKYNVNIDVATFNKLNPKEEKNDIFIAIAEAIFYANDKLYSLKTKTKKEEKQLDYNIVYVCNCDDFNKCTEKIRIKMNAVSLTRKWQDMPPNLMYPEIFANEVKKEVEGIENLTIKVLNKKEIEELNMGLLLAVNAGSYLEPRVVILEYNGDKNSSEKIGIVGKGITFDSGGYNLKPSAALVGMKFDMSGAAIATNSIVALAKVKAKVNVSSVVCLTENRIGGKAVLTESIITSMKGLTVQIDNTDAEGRLVLADGITYAIEKLKVTKIIELSTLTGAILVALGKNLTGVFANNDEWFEEFANATKKSHEEIWRMPIVQENIDAMRKTPIADLTNADASRLAGSSTAAAFLCEFVDNKPFIHLDIAGTADSDDKRGTGIMVKTLFQLLNK